jgi:serine/threonine-protein kinase
MATVHRAHDARHGRDVAVKVMLPAIAESLGADRFLRETETAARLQHPHIVPVFDSGNADGQLFFVMPLIEGESLRARLQREERRRCYARTRACVIRRGCSRPWSTARR